MAANEGCTIASTIITQPVFARPGDDAATVSALFHRLRDDYTEMEGDCGTAASALRGLASFVRDLIKVTDSLYEYGAQPWGEGVYAALKRQGAQQGDSLHWLAVCKLSDLEDMRAYLRGCLADEELRLAAAEPAHRRAAGWSNLVRDGVGERVIDYSQDSRKLLWQQALREVTGSEYSEPY